MSSSLFNANTLEASVDFAGWAAGGAVCGATGGATTRGEPTHGACVAASIPLRQGCSPSLISSSPTFASTPRTLQRAFLDSEMAKGDADSGREDPPAPSRPPPPLPPPPQRGVQSLALVESLLQLL